MELVEVVEVNQSNSVNVAISPSDNSTESFCGTCSLQVGEDSIGCDRDNCSVWYHPTPMCMGLPTEVIDSIIRFGGSGVAFVCTSQ